MQDRFEQARQKTGGIVCQFMGTNFCTGTKAFGCPKNIFENGWRKKLQQLKLEGDILYKYDFTMHPKQKITR